MRNLIILALIAINATLFVGCQKEKELFLTSEVPPYETSHVQNEQNDTSGYCIEMHDVKAEKEAAERRSTDAVAKAASNDDIVVYLDWNGGTIANTPWNATFNNGQPIQVPASGSAMTPAEKKAVAAIVAAFYDPHIKYRIVTSESAYNNANPYKRIRCYITTTLGNPSVIGNYGGRAYVGSWNWGNNTPAIVQVNFIGGDKVVNTALAIWHEMNHMFGNLHHGMWNGNQLQFEYEWPINQWSFESYAKILGNSNGVSFPYLGVGKTPDGHMQNDVDTLNGILQNKQDAIGNDFRNAKVAVERNGLNKAMKPYLEYGDPADVFFFNKQPKRLSIHVESPLKEAFDQCSTTQKISTLYLEVQIWEKKSKTEIIMVASQRYNDETFTVDIVVPANKDYYVVFKRHEVSVSDVFGQAMCSTFGAGKINASYAYEE